MTRHMNRECNDGNGFPGGIRLSWAALAVIVSAAALSFAVTTVLNANSARAIDKLDVRMTARFDKLDVKLDQTVSRVDKHCADPHAHERLSNP